jgi:hypothetical protein
VPLRLRHLDVVVHEHALPRHADFIEIEQCIVLVKCRGQWIVESGRRMGLEGFARQYLQAFGVERHHRREAVLFLAWLERLDRTDEHFIRDWTAGAEHFRTAYRDALMVFVAHAGDEEFVRLLAGALTTIRLRADDDVGEIEVIVAGVFVIVAHGRRARWGVTFEQVQTHVHAGDAGRNVVGRAPEHAARQLGPGFERLSALDQVGLRGWQLPHATDAVAGCG